ncbi:sensor histidine kinase [uncultured Kriegella sp.]|uniref:sensor histidine kinase n=1 Tax=uncultured Kriegella sp. TaxID=1798910 RepID=UPI0030DD85B4
MNVFTRVSNFGVSTHMNEDAIKKIRLVNQISLFTLTLSTFMLVTAIISDFPRIAILLFIPVTLILLLPLVLNLMGKTIASRIVLLFSTYAILFIQTLVYGPELHIHFFLIACIGAPLFLFNGEIGPFKWVFVFMVFPIWLYLEWHFSNKSPLIRIDPDSLYWPRLTNDLLLFAVIIFMFYIFSQQSNRQIKNIEKQRMAIEILLKEIHHRVKNNLQVITSLLALQSMGIKEQKIKNLFSDLQNRVTSMALSHEMLYQTNDLQRIDYEAYIRKLVNGLINSMKEREHEIDVQVDINNIYLNIDTSIPLGLIINELVTNSLKYAFKEDNGMIKIAIENLDDKNFRLEIGDNGVGFTNIPKKGKKSSLGLTLVQKLTIQLRGKIEKDNSKKGTNYIINFQEIMPKS